MPIRPARAKKAANLSIDRELLEAAKACGIDLSATLEQALGECIRAHRPREWVAEHRAAIELYNERVEREGTFSDGSRAF